MTSGDNAAGAPPVAKRVVIVGGVAGGMSTATRLRRLDATASITVLERSGHVSFANCGLPYFVGGLIEEEEDLTLQTPEQLFDRFRLDVRVDSEVVAIDRGRAHRHGPLDAHRRRDGRRLRQARAEHGRRAGAPSDPRLRPGPHPPDRRGRRPSWRPTSSVAPATAVVIGAGFIGLEMAENLVAQGLDVTIVEATPQVLPPLDPELAVLVADELRRPRRARRDRRDGRVGRGPTR